MQQHPVPKRPIARPAPRPVHGQESPAGHSDEDLQTSSPCTSCLKRPNTPERPPETTLSTATNALKHRQHCLPRPQEPGTTQDARKGRLCLPFMQTFAAVSVMAGVECRKLRPAPQRTPETHPKNITILMNHTASVGYSCTTCRGDSPTKNGAMGPSLGRGCGPLHHAVDETRRRHRCELRPLHGPRSQSSVQDTLTRPGSTLIAIHVAWPHSMPSQVTA